MNIGNFKENVNHGVLPVPSTSVFKMFNTTGLPFASGATEEAYLEAYSTAVPADASVGYQKSCIFHHTDGVEVNDMLYVNLGTAASSTFKAIMPAQVGSTSDPATTSTANTKFIAHYFENTATSGDNRAYYLRLYLAGAGGGGEALRAFTTISDIAAGTAHGAHLSLNFATSGTITGLGCGSRSTLHVINSALTGGTYCGAMSEIYCDGNSSDISGTTVHSIHRFVVAGGNATARGKVYNAFEFADIKSGTGATDMIKTDMHTATPTDGLRIIINGAVYHICLVSA